ncbi:hypothetical protein B23_0677 [Geobacillus thermoleovorans B23]|nr:hypothetical protein B23_0677 [Geobacillus thermoleovorans B23]
MDAGKATGCQGEVCTWKERRKKACRHTVVH